MKTVTERTTTTTVKDVRICCDVCGIGGIGSYDGGVNWKPTYSFEVAHTAIKATTGAAYPDGVGEEHIKSAHICNGCMDEKVWPFLESIMKTPPTEEEIDT